MTHFVRHVGKNALVHPIPRALHVLASGFSTIFSYVKTKTSPFGLVFTFHMGEGGFEPPKALPADLQSVPFGHSGIPPGAGDRSRTNNLLITNQLLCH